MSFSDHKIVGFTHKISDLPDQPNMQPEELKAHFDSSPEELRQALNALCDALAAQTAAADIGFAQTAGVPETTVQEAIENVQSQVTEAIIGSIPSGSITGDKLAQDVRDRLTAIESAAASEASTRASTDSGLQSQIDTHTGQITTLFSSKCEVYIGSYAGDDAEERTFALGFEPKAVLLFSEFGAVYNEGYCYGGLALPNFPCGPRREYPGIVITQTGFTVYNRSDFNGGQIYRYYNQANRNYYYIAFR